MLFMCLGLQVFCLMQVKRFVCAKAVHDIRMVYDRFETVMYRNHTFVHATEPTLERRGIGGPSGPHFDRALFQSMGAEEQAGACRIPLSQPVFFSAVLYIWTLTCIAELRRVKNSFKSLVLQTDTAESMVHSCEEEDGEFVVARLTYSMKLGLTILVIIPRLTITLYLLWVGCRWLLATNNFSDLILNSVALEFVLCLKDVLYLAIVSQRSMLDLESTRIKPANAKEPESLAVFIGTILWALVGAVWVLFYMGWPGHDGLQQVLVEYQWDVHEVCTKWISERFAV